MSVRPLSQAVTIDVYLNMSGRLLLLGLISRSTRIKHNGSAPE